MNPIGSSRDNHRQEQTALNSILCALEAPPDDICLASKSFRMTADFENDLDEMQPTRDETAWNEMSLYTRRDHAIRPYLRFLHCGSCGARALSCVFCVRVVGRTRLACTRGGRRRRGTPPAPLRAVAATRPAGRPRVGGRAARRQTQSNISDPLPRARREAARRIRRSLVPISPRPPAPRGLMRAARARRNCRALFRNSQSTASRARAEGAAAASVRRTSHADRSKRHTTRAHKRAGAANQWASRT